MTETKTEIDQEKLARWWVQLNAWIWPDDLPYKPKEGDLRSAMRGAFNVVDALVDRDVALALWQDMEGRKELIAEMTGA